jgi:hypothetical protein
VLLDERGSKGCGEAVGRRRWSKLGSPTARRCRGPAPGIPSWASGHRGRLPTGKWQTKAEGLGARVIDGVEVEGERTVQSSEDQPRHCRSRDVVVRKPRLDVRRHPSPSAPNRLSSCHLPFHHAVGNTGPCYSRSERSLCPRHNSSPKSRSSRIACPAASLRERASENSQNKKCKTNPFFRRKPNKTKLFVPFSKRTHLPPR